jgi:N-acetylneuraminate synthase
MTATDKTIQIAGRRIGRQHEPYVIGEISANHNGNIDNAFQLIDIAKAAGADAVKLQTYRPDTITIDCDKPDFQIEGGLWDGHSLYQLYEWAHTPWDWHKPLFDKAHEAGITLFSSPFDSTAVDLLEDLNAPAYKIASFELVDIPLIRYVASTGKPMIMSTGMANEHEIAEAIEAACNAGAKDLAILHCVSGYPSLASDYNLHTLADMQHRFDLVTGLSDHTLDNTTALGASIIEKHITLDRNGGGPDDSFSLEKDDLVQLCQGAKTAWQAMGQVNYQRTESEKGNARFRRSLYIVNDMRAGDTLTAENLKSIRPGFGMAPKMFDAVIGRKIKADVTRGTPLTEQLLAES